MLNISYTYLVEVLKGVPLRTAWTYCKGAGAALTDRGAAIKNN